MRKLNVVIIEDKCKLFEDQVEKYKRLFSLCGYNMHATHADGQGPAQKLIRSRGGIERIHVVISDIYSVGPKRGLLWIQRLKEEFPDLVVIGNSRQEISYRDTSVLYPSFDMYVDKNMLNRAEKETDRVVTEQFLGCMNQDVDVFVAPESDLTNLKGDDFKNGADDRALNSLVAQVVYAPGEFDMALHPTSVRLSPITSGFSGSYVFRMDIECPKSGLRTVPAVLKISRDDQALVEAANYKKYVKWILPYRWRVDLLGDGRVKGWSAVCYSFVHSAGHSFNSVTDALLKSDSKAVIQVVDQIFSPSYQTWYSKRLCTESGSTQISAHYSKEYFTTKSLAECGSQFRRHAQRYLGADTSDSGIVHFRELGVTIKEPSTELFAVGRGAFIETICHGDLNSNNIMISGTELTFIDFQSTGRKHVFRDFVTFESSIRLYYSDAPDDGKTCIECEGVISSADVLQERIGDKPDLPEMYRLILRVRQAAMRNFPDEPMSNYLYGATVFSLRLLRITELSPKQYTRLLCQIVSGMSRIKT